MGRQVSSPGPGRIPAHSQPRCMVSELAEELFPRSMSNHRQSLDTPNPGGFSVPVSLNPTHHTDPIRTILPAILQP